MYKLIDLGVCAPLGFYASGLHCGIRKNKSKKDLSLVYSEIEAISSACYTQNKVKGAPILVTQQHLKKGNAQVMLCNSGNANTCNSDGIDIANQMSRACATSLGIDESLVIIASTGVIGQRLPIEPIVSSMDTLVQQLNRKGHKDACEGIMTTDTFTKEIAIEFLIQGKKCRIGAMAKGSGMIHPNMATMLSFITSDVAIKKELLDQVLKEVIDETFNMVSVDGDTSTNDMVSIMCNGLAKNKGIDDMNEDYQQFKEALYDVCASLSKMIASDGEGATKCLTCTIKHAKEKETAKIIAKSIICSSLFKAAMFGQDANWGRILCAIGYADASFDIDLVDVYLKSNGGSMQVCASGRGVHHPQFSSGIDEEKAKMILKEKEIEIIIDMNQGETQATAWGCDLSYDYVKINGDYRS